MVALLIIFVWGATGSIFGYSDNGMVINTGTTIVTFLMVFLIQNSQNRDAAAMQTKLDELLRAMDDARSQFIGIEHLSDSQIERIGARFELEVNGDEGKATTAEETVDQLLKRR